LPLLSDDKALEIAQTTCNRDIYALMEVPAYGYSPSDAADIVNKFADAFYNSSECLCFATDSCKEPTVTISNRGWFGNTPFPVEQGGDGLSYPANSDSPASPWFESMVFPENPSGKIKTPQLSPERRVCDGVVSPQPKQASLLLLSSGCFLHHMFFSVTALISMYGLCILECV
jgi:hypothetical protein